MLPMVIITVYLIDFSTMEYVAYGNDYPIVDRLFIPKNMLHA
jgi:hypothetical protein